VPFDYACTPLPFDCHSDILLLDCPFYAPQVEHPLNVLSIVGRPIKLHPTSIEHHAAINRMDGLIPVSAASTFPPKAGNSLCKIYIRRTRHKPAWGGGIRPQPLRKTPLKIQASGSLWKAVQLLVRRAALLCARTNKSHKVCTQAYTHKNQHTHTDARMHTLAKTHVHACTSHVLRGYHQGLP